jgi:hypothetical protein
MKESPGAEIIFTSKDCNLRVTLSWKYSNVKVTLRLPVLMEDPMADGWDIAVRAIALSLLGIGPLVAGIVAARARRRARGKTED